jgi:hypothetical protein
MSEQKNIEQRYNFGQDRAAAWQFMRDADKAGNLAGFPQRDARGDWIVRVVEQAR